MAETGRGRVAIAPEVEELAASHGVDPRAERLAVGEFRCLVCQLDGSLDRGEDASLVVVRYPESGNMFLRMAHPQCGPSQILDLDGPGELKQRAELDVRSMAARLPGPDGQITSVLFIDRSDPSGVLTPGGDFQDPWLQTLLQDGWELVAGGETDLPVMVGGYEIALAPETAQGEVSSPHGLFLDRLASGIEPLWFDFAEKRGFVWVFAGELRLDQIGALTVPALINCLDDARRRAAVVTARVTVSGAHPEPLRQAAAHLAGVFDQVVHSTRPGDGNAFDDLPPLVEFPVPPRLLVADFAGTPTLIVDINDDDDPRARRTFKAFQRAGLAIVAPSKVWKQMPAGWSALLWPSQALILAPDVAGGDDQRRVLFAEYEERPQGLTWYREAMAYQVPSVFLMVTNLKGRDLSESAIGNRIDRGRVLGGAILSMGTVEC